MLGWPWASQWSLKLGLPSVKGIWGSGDKKIVDMFGHVQTHKTFVWFHTVRESTDETGLYGQPDRYRHLCVQSHQSPCAEIRPSTRHAAHASATLADLSGQDAAHMHFEGCRPCRNHRYVLYSCCVISLNVRLPHDWWHHDGRAFLTDFRVRKFELSNFDACSAL